MLMPMPCLSLQSFKSFKALAALVVAVGSICAAPPAAPKTPRLYVFDCGELSGLNPNLFGFEKSQLAEVDFVGICYLVVHPKGTLMWDVGTVPDSAFKGDGQPVKEGISLVRRPLLPQLAAVGYKPADITYLAMSHYHSDHTANANSFVGSTWLVQKAERDAMFGEKPVAIMKPESYSLLKDAKTIILPNAEFDVFGDGTVVIKPTPGHTPGHQVLYLKLAKFGGVLLAGDLYHYPEERTAKKTPSFEFNREQSLVSRASIDKFLESSKAQMWIGHDKPTFMKNKKAPEFYE
jgi:N-acyl homoserine lactone hydrolase